MSEPTGTDARMRRRLQEAEMRDYSELLTELHSLADDKDHANVFRQAAQALEQLMCDQPQLAADWPFPGEPSDHEAEGAMLYVMSRGKPAT